MSRTPFLYIYLDIITEIVNKQKKIIKTKLFIFVKETACRECERIHENLIEKTRIE